MAHCVQAVHALGGKLGLYLVAGISDGIESHTPITAFNRIEQDAATLANWGVDYVKFDSKLLTQDQAETFYSRFTRELDRVSISNKAPQLIYVEGVTCTYTEALAGNTFAKPWMTSLVNGIRLCGDANWGTTHATFWGTMLAQTMQYPFLCGIGHYTFNNGVGAIGLNGQAWWTIDDTRAHLGIVALMCGELQTALLPHLLDSAELPIIYRNPEFTALFRDPIPTQGWPVLTNGNGQVWVRPMNGGTEWLVGLWNLGTNSTLSISCNLSNCPGLVSNVVVGRDIYSRTNVSFTNAITATVNTNGLNLYKLKSISGYTGNYADTNGVTWTFFDGKLQSVAAAAAVPWSPTNISGLAYYWNYRDATAGATFSWPDRIQGIVLTNAAGFGFATLDANGVRFAHSGSPSTSTYLTNALITVASNYSLCVWFKQSINCDLYQHLAGAIAPGPNGGMFLDSTGLAAC